MRDFISDSKDVLGLELTSHAKRMLLLQLAEEAMLQARVSLKAAEEIINSWEAEVDARTSQELG